MITSTAFSSSPFLILKVSQVSQPFNPNSGSAVWTTYTYDGSGRATAVVAPDGASTTQTSYSGNSTTVTDAAGMWKTSTSDTFGNLTLLTEPNPAGGANWTTSYTYNALNQLTQVSMTRPQGTQTRTFGYTGTDMTTETNPENGTVTYTYDNAHNLMSKTDNIGQKTVYTRDAYARVTEIQHYVWQSGTLVEDLKQRVNYTYDTGTNGQGRLTGVTFGMNDNSGGGGSGTFTYGYGYNVAGRITSQTMSIPSPLAINLSASYVYDTLTEKEGKLLSMTYPTYGGSNALVFDYQYDSIGRLNGMTEDQGYGQGQQSMATATLGPAGQLTALSYDLFANGVGINETIGYNNLLQPTHMKAIAQYGGQTYMDVLYNFSSTQNNGRIVSSTDNVTGENVSYTYDALNRLSTASAGSMWGESYTYDGFGNLTSKSVTQSPAPAMSATYYANNQQMGISYDGNGNQTWDSGYVTQYTWNVENRLALTQGSGTTTWYSYDDRGRRVMKDANSTPGTYSSGNWEFYFYGIDGQKVMTLECFLYSGAYYCYPQFDIHFGRKLLQSKGNPVVTDRLGSVRWNYYNTVAYYPWGEERTSTSDDFDKFGTYLRDSPGQDYAQHRYYNLNVGRFWSPDPAGVKAARFGNPTSWNHYLYALGDPVNFNDPVGKDADCADTDDGCVDDGCGGAEEPCQVGSDTTGGGGGADPSVAAANCSQTNLAGCPAVLATTTVCSQGQATTYQGQTTCGDVPLNPTAQATLGQTSTDLGFVQTAPNSYTQVTVTAGPVVATVGISVTVTSTGSVFVAPAVSAGISTPLSGTVVTGTVPQGTNVDDWAAGASLGWSYGYLFGFGTQWSNTSSGVPMSYESGLYSPQATVNGTYNLCSAGPCLPPPPPPARLGR